MNYIEDTGLLEAIFELISAHYSINEEIPSYRNERGFVNLLATLERVKEDVYYPDLLSKATYLFTNINKGHYFSNGNKRLSIVVLFFFLFINKYGLKNESKDWYKKHLGELFPECSDIPFEDFSDFTSVDFCIYHLAIRTAASGKYNINHDELKRRMHKFLEEVIEEVQLD